jgi:hypothetical protein
MSGDANAAAATSFLSRDLISTILLRLPAIVLRRLSLVCKEWRNIISDPIFIKTHMVEGPTAPTHTIVFVPSSEQYRAGNGFLFDERWRLAARFAVGASEAMVGTCNGLLCFHDGRRDLIKIVEPFTGEAIVLPVPTDSPRKHDARSYCFGFDATARRYKIVHQVSCSFLKVFTLGADEGWRTVSIPPCASVHSDLACDGGTVYWNHNGYANRTYGGFDLATEQIITPVKRCLANGRPITCHHPRWRDQPFVFLIRRFASESQDDYWPHDMNTMAIDTHGVIVPHGRHLPRPHALQRGHLLLQEANGAVYAHKIMTTTIHELKIGWKKLLIDSDLGLTNHFFAPKNGQFVPVHSGGRSKTQQPVATASEDICTFAYTPTVSVAPLALYLGTHG